MEALQAQFALAIEEPVPQNDDEPPAESPNVSPRAGAAAATGPDISPLSPSASTELPEERTKQMLMKVYEFMGAIRKENLELKAKIRKEEENEDDDEELKDLKSLDPKDVEKPIKFDGKDFLTWHTVLMNYMKNKDASWKILMETIQKKGDKIIRNGKEIANEMEDKRIKKFIGTYEFQLFHVLLNYTAGDTRNKVLLLEQGGVFEAYRGIYKKGINRSEDMIIYLHAAVLHPEPAKNEEDIEKATMEWRKNIRIVTQATGNPPLTPSQEKTLYLRILPELYQKFVKKECRSKSYEETEQAVQDEIQNQKKGRKGKGSVNAVTPKEGEEHGEDVEEDWMWSEYYGWICFMAAKGQRSDERKYGNSDVEMATPEAEPGKGTKSKERRESAQS